MAAGCLSSRPDDIKSALEKAMKDNRLSERATKA
jgi:hypothetical protein